MARPALKTLTTVPREAKDEFVRLCSSGRLKDALHHRFRDALWSDAGLFSHLFRACRALSLLRQLHAFAATNGAAADRFTANHLLLAYADLGDLPTARDLFERIPKRNVMSWNILIGGYIKNSDLGSAGKLFDEMPTRNVTTWNTMVAGLTNVGLDGESSEFFLAMRREGMQPDEFGLGTWECVPMLCWAHRYCLRAAGPCICRAVWAGHLGGDPWMVKGTKVILPA